MRLVTANVNGIRAAERRGGLSWLAAHGADVVALQEVRADDDQLAKVLADHGFGDWEVVHAPAEAKGRAGVAVLSRLPVRRRAVGLPGPEAAEFATSGRWVEADLETADGVVTVASAYVHAGDANSPRQQEKYRFLDAVTSRMREWTTEGRRAVVTGDLNVAHREDDLKNWKGNLSRSGFLPQERAVFDGWFDGDGELRWVDVHRVHHGPGPGPYTWWSWRGKAFDNDSGWRIDYQLASPSLAPSVTDAWVGRAPAYDQRWSDHAPVVVDYDLGTAPR